jgi:L,D-transpeptidase catalytic domain
VNFGKIAGRTAAGEVKPSSLGCVTNHSNSMSTESTLPDETLKLGLPGVAWLGGSRRVAALLALLLIGLVALGTLATVRASQDTVQAQAAARAQQSQLDQALQQARAQGYTVDDLAQIVSSEKLVAGVAAPILIWLRPTFYRDQAAQLSQLQGSLQGREEKLIGDAKSATAQSISSAKQEIAKDHNLGVDDASLATLQQRLDTFTKNEQSAKVITDFRNTQGQARQLLSDAQAVGKAQTQENSVIDAAAAHLITQQGGNIDSLRQIAKDNLSGARNDAALAAYMNFGDFFKGDYLSLNVAYQRLERYSSDADSGDLNQVAKAAAAGQRYGGQVHDQLFKAMPPKIIVVSHDAQRFWAYENGGLVQESNVTTGRPTLETDLGPMHVQHKNHPWLMHSPWPAGSADWYPDTVVQYATFFTNTGEALHTAPWEADSAMGQGSEYTANGSHGCIHMPYDEAVWTYNWADVGMPVIVYPGDSSPASSQFGQHSTDTNGVPTNGENFRGL